MSSSYNIRTRKRKRKTTEQQPASTTVDHLSFFEPSKYRLFNEAHQKVESLVFGEDGQPFRRKLLELVESNLNDCKNKNWVTKCAGKAAGDVVELAWKKTVYCWADPTTDENCSKDESSAYMSFVSLDNGETVPYIAISSSFKENDYHQSRDGPLDQPPTTDNMTKLFFFKKIKHEICHVMARFVSIYENNVFQKNDTPEKYTPRKQPPRKHNPVPEVGDHDEEEDAGGPILPLYFNKKLDREKNPLCLVSEGKYLALSDAQIGGLLRLDYTMEIEERPHTSIVWSAKECRAFVAHTLQTDFYDGESIPRIDIVPNTASSSSRSSASLRASSPSPTKRSPGGSSSDDDDIFGYSTPRWRLCTTPLRVPSSVFFPKLDGA